MATEPILACRGCGATRQPTGDALDELVSDHCGECPPWRCEDCGEMCSAAALCPCWLRIEDMSLADIKAAFATIDLSVATPDTTGGQQP